MSKSLNNYIDDLLHIRTTISDLNAQVDELKHKRDDIEKTVMSMLDENEVSLMRGRSASVSISETETASVEDWDQFEKYIIDNNALYLLQRRPANQAYRELVKTNGPIPGVTTFIQRRLNLRKT